VTLLDASGIISLIAGEPGADRVADLLREPGSAITSLNLAEVIDHMERVEGYAPAELLGAVDVLIDSGMEVLPVNHEDGRLAGELRATHYDARRRPLSMADCVLLACAIDRQARLATSDAALAGVGLLLSLEVIGFPNSAGRLP
jgi:predicted nucleic acid-binding protein